MADSITSGLGGVTHRHSCVLKNAIQSLYIEVSCIRSCQILLRYTSWSSSVSFEVAVAQGGTASKRHTIKAASNNIARVQTAQRQYGIENRTVQNTRTSKQRRDEISRK